MKIALVCSLLGVLCGAPPSGGIMYPDEGTGTIGGDTFIPAGGGNCEDAGTASNGITQFKAVQAIPLKPGHCRWVIDMDELKQSAAYEDHRQALYFALRSQALYFALRSRPLSDSEMKEVEDMGLRLVTPIGVSYNEEEKTHELNDALLTQYKIREIARTRDSEKFACFLNGAIIPWPQHVKDTVAIVGEIPVKMDFVTAEGPVDCFWVDANTQARGHSVTKPLN